MTIKDIIQPKEAVQDIKTKFLSLKNTNGSQDESWTTVKVTGIVEGQEITFYDFYQSRFSGDGMSTSSVTRTDSVRIGESRRNYGKELHEFRSLQSDFYQLNPKLRTEMSKLNGQPAINSLVETLQKYSFDFSRFRPIMESKYAEKIFNQATKGKVINYGGIHLRAISL